MQYVKQLSPFSLGWYLCLHSVIAQSAYGCSSPSFWSTMLGLGMDNLSIRSLLKALRTVPWISTYLCKNNISFLRYSTKCFIHKLHNPSLQLFLTDNAFFHTAVLQMNTITSVFFFFYATSSIFQNSIHKRKTYLVHILRKCKPTAAGLLESLIGYAVIRK